MSKPRLSAKQATFVQYYADPGSPTYNNAARSAEKAGYSKRSINQIGVENLTKPLVKAAIEHYRAEIAEKLDHDRTSAIKLLTADYAHLESKATGGDVSAIAARTTIIRELNAISNLHKATVVSEQGKPTLSTGERGALEQVAKEFKGKLVRNADSG